MDTLAQLPSSLQIHFSINGRHRCRCAQARQAYTGGSRTRSGELYVAWSPLSNRSRKYWSRSCSRNEFAGWSDTNANDWATPADGKKGLGGVAAAGLVGVIILFAGVSINALRLKKQNPTMIMEPIKSEHEELLVADRDDNDHLEAETKDENIFKNAIAVQEDNPQENIDSIATSSSELISEDSSVLPNDMSDTTQSEEMHSSSIQFEDETVDFREMQGMSATEKDEEKGLETFQQTHDSLTYKGVENYRGFLSASALPAPIASPTSEVLPEKVLVPASVDEAQVQTLVALQTMKVIEDDAKPGDLCTRRNYARWLVVASGTLSRNVLSKVYPAMFIEGTELAFDDVTPNDPDFPYIQGLAEAGLIASKLSSISLSSPSDDPQLPVLFSPESPICRQDLVSWKMALEKRKLLETDEKMLYEVSGFRDIDRIHPHAWAAIRSDLTCGDMGMVSLAFGFTRLFQPDKAVTNAQAAVALSTGESADAVHEELARIAAESAADDAVSVHNELIAQVEKELRGTFEKQLMVEKEKTCWVEQKIEELVTEIEELRSQREETKGSLIRERAAIEAELEMVAKLRKEAEESVEKLASKKVAVAYEKDRISKIEEEMVKKREEIGMLQRDLEVEKRALAMARQWAEEEATKARDQAKALDDARDRWEKHGIKVIVEHDLRDPTAAALHRTATLHRTASTAHRFTANLKDMADTLLANSNHIISILILKLQAFLLSIKNASAHIATSALLLTDDFIRWFRHTLRGRSPMP